MTVSRKMSILTFSLGGRQFGLPLDRVIEIALRVEITALPEVLPPITGLTLHRGVPTPVIDISSRLLGEAMVPTMADHFIFASTTRRPVALMVGRAQDLTSIEVTELVPPPQSARLAAGIMQAHDGVMVLIDLDAALNLEAERSFDRALHGSEAQSSHA